MYLFSRTDKAKADTSNESYTSILSVCEVHEWLTTTCGTESTSASAAVKLLYCCGLSMTSSFFGALPALPCIVNGHSEISQSWIPKRSGQPAYPKSFSPFSDSHSPPHTAPCSDWEQRTHSHTQAEEVAPPTLSCAAWGSSTHTHTHTNTHTHTRRLTHTHWNTHYSYLTPHYPPAWWHRVDKGKQKTHIPQVLQSGQGASTPCSGQLK